MTGLATSGHSISGSKVNLLRNGQSVVDLDTQISNRAFQFCVAEQELDGPEIAGLLVDQSRLCAPQGVGAIGRRVQVNGLHPSLNEPGVLPGGQARR